MKSLLPAASRSLLDVIAGHVERDPERRAYTALSARGREMRPRDVSFADLWAGARAAAAELAERCVSSGDRVLLCIDRTETFLSYFLGAQGLGAIPVPLPAFDPFAAPTAFRERVAGVAADARPAAVVVDSETAEARLRGVLPVDVAVVVSSSVATTDARAPFRTKASLGDVALLQYTSGSTGAPKGVIVDHGNLVANFRASTLAAGFGPDEVSVSWLPLYHDMGIIGGLLLGLYLRTHAVVMAPRHFLLRPESWLWAMHHFHATFTVAPNFAYNLVARKLPDAALDGLDLSSLRLAFDGAEPIDADTLAAFEARFRRYGLREDALYPVYGLAECTLAVAFPRAGEPVHVDRVSRGSLAAAARAEPAVETDAPRHVSVGAALPEHRVVIREVGGDRALDEREVGEICVSGPSCTRGYWNHPERGGEVRTGDLGYLAEGRLYVIDRLKDLVILAGRNFVPSDIERAASTVEGVAPGGAVAFAVRGGDGTDELCVVVTVQPTSWRSTSELVHDVARAVNERIGVTPHHVVPVPPGQLPKTSSGKLRRRACRERWETGVLRSARGIAARTGMKVTRLRQQLARRVAGSRESELPEAT